MVGELPVISFGLKNIFKIHEMIPFLCLDLNTNSFFEKEYGRSFVDLLLEARARTKLPMAYESQKWIGFGTLLH